MTDYSNYKVLKSVINYIGNDEEKIIAAQEAQLEYENVAKWCDENQNYYLGNDELYYKVIEKIPETEEQKAEYVRETRNEYLVYYVDPFVSNPLRWADMSEQDQNNIINYMFIVLLLLLVYNNQDFLVGEFYELDI